MFTRSPSSRRWREIDADLISESAALATRRSRPTPVAISPEDGRRVEADMLRRVYDEAVEAGLPPAPADFSGCQIGAITVIARAEDGYWTVHNPNPIAGVDTTYSISAESLLASYASGDLVLPPNAS